MILKFRRIEAGYYEADSPRGKVELIKHRVTGPRRVEVTWQILINGTSLFNEELSKKDAVEAAERAINRKVEL